jgi:23S rRNA pseudouridine1911/1915/1917 synthase
MPQTFTFTVEQTLPGERLDKFLHAKFPMVSRATIQRLIDERAVRVNSQPVKPAHHPHAGDVIQVDWPEAKSSEAQPEEIPLEILYEDDDLLVINKPPGMVVHPSAGHASHTLVNALLHHCQGQLSGIGGVARPGIVHRLDMETSGCLVVAKNDTTHLALSTQFATRSLDKVYLAIVCGQLPQESGQICAAIARHPSHRKRMAVAAGGRKAKTSYCVLERLRAATLVEARPHTGRTHQIRVHFQHIGYPLAGDPVYGRRQTKQLAELTGYSAPRHLLHAHKLTFTHPRSGQTVSLTAPLPRDFLDALTALRYQANSP